MDYTKDEKGVEKMEINPNEKLLYKSSEVAKLLNITTATLKKLVLNGKIDAITVNTHRFFTKEAIEKFINENSTANCGRK